MAYRSVASTQNLLEFARSAGIGVLCSHRPHGGESRVPWARTITCSTRSARTSTKVSGELLSRIYSHLYGISFIALRFFTVWSS
jgi:UDP-glucuronate 4-epimerase